MQALLKVADGIDTFIEWVGRFAVLLMPVVVLVGVYNVISRYLGRAIGQNLSSNLFIELQWYLFSLIFLLAAAYVLKHDEHVRVDVLYARFSPRAKAWVNLLGSLLILIPFCALLIYFSWPAVQNSWKIFEGSPDPSGLPRYPLKTVILISPALLIIEGVAKAIRSLAVLVGADTFHEEIHDKSVL